MGSCDPVLTSGLVRNSVSCEIGRNKKLNVYENTMEQWQIYLI